ncbi:MAG: hypothetical protein KF860_03655 [Cyclobacteriaceae bacterium]|nr:hypothetical protein [Cyclobacteriaceae bacterium]
MRFFDFLKEKEAADYFGKVISVTLDNINWKDLPNCKRGDYVKLWTKPEMDKVIIYAPNSVGGSGQLGTIPSKYTQIIKAHILGQKDCGLSGPSTNNYCASIIDLSGSCCTIGIKLYSAKEHEQIILDIVQRDRAATKKKLEKKYKMTKPVEIKFDLKRTEVIDFEKMKLKIFEKEFYTDYPYDYKLQLIDETTSGVIAETFSQKDKIFRVVKAHYNGQKLSIAKIEKEGNYLKAIVSGE